MLCLYVTLAKYVYVVCDWLQASALRLQQESRELESKVQQAYVRLENGEAPDEEALLHWEKTLLNQNRKKQEEMAAMKVLCLLSPGVSKSLSF